MTYDERAATITDHRELDGWAEGIRLCPGDDEARWAALARRRAELRRLK